MVSREKMEKKLNGYKVFKEKPKSETYEKVLRLSLMVFALFATFSLLLTGCSSKTVDDTSVPAVNTEQTNSDVPLDDGNVPVVDSDQVEIDVSGTKSEVEKTQETIVQLIADGTYNEQVKYMSPAGTETVEIDITVEGDVVTAASVTVVSADDKSERYINNFNSALPELVVGKKISDISIPKTVSGSSLTSAAFKNHLNGLVEKY